MSAFLIFTNKTLEALVRERPTTPHELAAIKGFRPAIREQYGAAILTAIAGSSPPARHVPEPVPDRPSKNPSPEPRPVAEPVITKPTTASPSRTYVPTEEWTWRLLDRGFSLDEAAAIRGLEVSAIVKHALLMARKGHPIAIERCISADLLRQWEERRKRGESEPPTEPEDAAGLWALFLASR